MRISDWSSDVCSSDLMHRLVQHPRVMSPPAENVLKKSFESSITTELLAHHSVDKSVYPTQTRMLTWKLWLKSTQRIASYSFDLLSIGRASCREEVFKSGYIRVGDE